MALDRRSLHGSIEIGVDALEDIRDAMIRGGVFSSSRLSQLTALAGLKSACRRVKLEAGYWRVRGIAHPKYGGPAEVSETTVPAFESVRASGRIDRGVVKAETEPVLMVMAFSFTIVTTILGYQAVRVRRSSERDLKAFVGEATGRYEPMS